MAIGQGRHGKKYALIRKANGEVAFVGTRSEIARQFETEVHNIDNQLRHGGDLWGIYTAREATPEDVLKVKPIETPETNRPKRSGVGVRTSSGVRFSRYKKEENK